MRISDWSSDVCSSDLQLLLGREEELPRHRLGEIAVGLLDEQAVAVIEHVAMEGEPVAVAVPPFDFAGVVQEVRRLADEVERDVGKAEVDLDRRRMTTPFAEALAEEQAVVAEAEEIVDERPEIGRAHV